MKEDHLSTAYSSLPIIINSSRSKPIYIHYRNSEKEWSRWKEPILFRHRYRVVASQQLLLNGQLTHIHKNVAAVVLFDFTSLFWPYHRVFTISNKIHRFFHTYFIYYLYYEIFENKFFARVCSMVWQMVSFHFLLFCLSTNILQTNTPDIISFMASTYSIFHTADIFGSRI